MDLSYDLISQFAKVVNKDKKQTSESTVYGTIVDENGDKYVRLDGSELLTPLSYKDGDVVKDFMTATAKDGDRVSVLVKDHTATVTGNLSSPAVNSEDVDHQIETFNIAVIEQVNANTAYIDKLQADKADISELEAATAEIERLNVDKASVDDLSAVNSEVTNLKTVKMDVDVADAKFATIEKLNATDADIAELEADHAEFKSATVEDISALDAVIKNANLESLDTTYANIDFSNIGKAAMEYFYSQSGLIKNVTVGDQTITGNLVGVTISGDLIEGNTVKADKLVIKGSDGLYYKLNTDGVDIETEQTDHNSINGQVIKAKSITATKINVSDLVAFDATIGGFNITDTSLYSGVKSSVSNTTRGIYLDKDGQFACGDSNNYFKYYKDSDGSYKLEISAVNDIEVGGRNLLINTKKLSGFYANNDTTDFIVGSDGYTYASFPSVTSASYRAMSSTYSMLNSELVMGRQVTFSFEMRSDVAWTATGTNIIVGFALCNDTSSTRLKYRTVYLTGDIENKWTRFEVKATLTEDYFINGTGSFDDCTCFYVQIYNYSTNPLQVRKPKLEYGNKGTDYTEAPEDIDVNVSEAAKVASDYMSYDSSNGLQIGNKSSGSWSGFRTQITNSAFRILNIAGTVLASYGEKLIELGKNATDAVIKFCGGKGQIEYDSVDSSLQLTGNKVRLKGDSMASIYSKYYDNNTNSTAAAVNVSPESVNIFAQKSENIDPDTLVGTWNTSEVTVTPDEITAISTDNINLTSRNDVNIESIDGDVKINGKTVNFTDRIARAYTQETNISYTANSYIKLFRDQSPTDLYNQGIATFNTNGTITINKDILASINIHIVSGNSGGRSWIRLMNCGNNWKYTDCITYGSYTTSQINIVLPLTKNTIIGIQTVEAITINSSGLVGSYIEIIEL